MTQAQVVIGSTWSRVIAIQKRLTFQINHFARWLYEKKIQLAINLLSKEEIRRELAITWLARGDISAALYLDLLLEKLRYQNYRDLLTTEELRELFLKKGRELRLDMETRLK